MSSPTPEPSQSETSLPVKPGTIETTKTERISFSAAEATFSGPIPPPKMLEEYNRISSGLALRLVNAQLRDREKSYAEARFGQTCALLIALAALGIGSFTALQGHEWASALGLSGIGGIVATFISGRNRQQESEKEPPK